MNTWDIYADPGQAREGIYCLSRAYKLHIYIGASINGVLNQCHIIKYLAQLIKTASTVIYFTIFFIKKYRPYIYIYIIK